MTDYELAQWAELQRAKEELRKFDRVLQFLIFAVLWLIVLAYAGYQIGRM